MNIILDKLRKERGMTKEELAYKAEVSYSMITAIENGSRIPGLRIANRLAKVLGVKVDDLINGTKEEK